MNIGSLSAIGSWLTSTAVKQEPAYTQEPFEQIARTIASSRTGTVLTGQTIPVSASVLAAQEVAPIKVESIQRLGVELKATPISQAPEALYETLINAQEDMLKHQYSTPPSAAALANYAPGKPYATVMVGGEVVAEIDNQGGTTTSNALGALLHNNLPNDVNGTNGPNLAQARAEKIAALLGGKVIKASTAMTQMQFSALQPLEPPQPTIDYEAMKNDPMYLSLQKLKEQRAVFLAQQQPA